MNNMMFDEHMNRHAVTMKSLVHTHLQHSSTRKSLRGNARSFSDAFSIATHSILWMATTIKLTYISSCNTYIRIRNGLWTVLVYILHVMQNMKDRNCLDHGVCAQLTFVWNNRVTWSEWAFGRFKLFHQCYPF